MNSIWCVSSRTAQTANQAACCRFLPCGDRDLSALGARCRLSAVAPWRRRTRHISPASGSHDHDHRRARTAVQRGDHHARARARAGHRERLAALRADAGVRRRGARRPALRALRAPVPLPGPAAARTTVEDRGRGAAPLRAGRWHGDRRDRRHRLRGRRDRGGDGLRRAGPCRRVPERGLRPLPRLPYVPTHSTDPASRRGPTKPLVLPTGKEFLSHEPFRRPSRRRLGRGPYRSARLRHRRGRRGHQRLRQGAHPQRDQGRLEEGPAGPGPPRLRGQGRLRGAAVRARHLQRRHRDPLRREQQLVRRVRVLVLQAVRPPERRAARRRPQEVGARLPRAEPPTSRPGQRPATPPPSRTPRCARCATR